MTYGFEAKNSSGEIVIDDTFPCHAISSQTTITGTPAGINFTYPRPPSGTLRFWFLNVGDAISLSPDLFFGNRSSYIIREVIPAYLLPTPTGYGAVVYNQLGQKVYVASSDLITIGDKYSVTPSGSPVSVSDNWFALETYYRQIIPFGINGLSLTSGVKKLSNTEVEFFGVFFSSAPNITDVRPSPFLTAK